MKFWVDVPTAPEKSHSAGDLPNIILSILVTFKKKKGYTPYSKTLLNVCYYYFEINPTITSIHLVYVVMFFP